MSANSPANSTPPVPESIHGSWPSWFLSVASWLTQIARNLNLARRGKINSVGTVTLAAGAKTTTLTDDRIGPSSFIGFCPLTDSAASNIPYASSRGSGTATLTHGSSIASDMNFVYIIID